MGSNAKRKTTMAELQRESKLRDKRAMKAMKKEMRKREAAEGPAEPTQMPDDLLVVEQVS